MKKASLFEFLIHLELKDINFFIQISHRQTSALKNVSKHNGVSENGVIFYIQS